ncbi:amidohydrolase [Arthrobacter sp. ISL-30]|uniref:amidohydrolase family protein n=1 Tax=Arthrobacter sp. ISL-30 TaxID=2819109 RepID=UPI001BE7F4EB|nr:amidohydrolase family protein [Arthrobacter sp. ISL-30]MBT2513382.1 amidohydrolase family protein [Arthrobacter sp. ISL-30]
MIDAHLHLWEVNTDAATVANAQRPYSWLGPQHGALFRSFGEAEAEETLYSAGVRGAVLVQADDTLADTRSMLSVAERNSWVLGVVGWIPLDTPAKAEEELEQFLRHPVFCGVRHLVHDDPRDDFLDLPQVRQSLQLLARHGLAFDVPDAFPRHLGATLHLACDLPQLTVILDHLGKPPLADAEALEVWRKDFRGLAELPNSIAKISGLHLPGVPYTAEALRPLWDQALEAFGPSRLMIGSDWPVSSLGAPYERTMGVLLELVDELSLDEQHQILEGTAKRSYSLIHKEVT